MTIATQPTTQLRFTPLPPDHAAAVIVQTLVASGAQVQSQTDRSITGLIVLRQRPSAVAAFLLLLWVIPGVVYLVTAGRDIRNPFAIQLIPRGQGTLVHPAGQGYGLQVAVEAVSRLPT